MNDTRALGWLPDLPDFRDYSDETKNVHGLLKAVGIANPMKLTLATSADL